MNSGSASPDGSDRARADIFDRWLGRLFRQRGGSAGLLWQLIPAARRPGADDGYGVVPGTDTDTAAMLYRWVRDLAGGT